VAVTLLDAGGSPVATTTTAADGTYAFRGLAAGDYAVAFTFPSGVFITGPDAGGDDATDSDIGVSDGRTGPLTVAAGATRTDVDAGVFESASLSGSVYADADDDGVQEAGDPGIGGVTVTLTGTDDLGAAVLVTVVTDAAGGFRFGNLRPGTYTITESQPAGYLDGRDTAGTSGGTIGDDTFSAITVTPGADGSGYRFAELQPVSIAGRVWLDGDASTTVDPGEAGEPGVPVTLRRDGDGDGTYETAMATMATDDDGNYAFPGVPPGAYLVEVTVPPGMTATTPASVPVTAAGGQAVTDVDVGLVTGAVDLAVQKEVLGDVVIGAPATWLITVSNIGTVDLAGPMTVTDTLPAGTSYLGTTTPDWTCSAAGQVVTCTHPNPPAPGASTRLGIVADVTAAAANPLRNQAVVAVPSGEVTMENNTDVAVAEVLPPTAVPTTTVASTTVPPTPDPTRPAGARPGDQGSPGGFNLPVTGWSASGVLVGLVLVVTGGFVLMVRNRRRRPT
jgi:uncharacterized repeat protein (TIGR01451 family)